MILLGLVALSPFESRPEKNGDLSGDAQQIDLPDVDGKRRKADVKRREDAPCQNRNDGEIMSVVEPDGVED